MRKKGNFFILFFIFLCFFVLVNIFTPISGVIRGSSLSIISSSQKFFLEKGNDFFKNFEAFKNTKKISAEIENLRKINNELNSRISLLLTVEEENKALRDILEISLFEKENLIFSQVVGRDIINNEVVIKHDKTIDSGWPVVTSEGVLIGVIGKTEKNGFATVKLLTNSNTALEVKIQNDDLPIGILKGDEGKGVYIDLLPKDKSLNIGEYVVTVPNNKGIKKEFYIGRVSQIEENNIEAFKKALVWQGVDYRYLNYLFVVD